MIVTLACSIPLKAAGADDLDGFRTRYLIYPYHLKPRKTMKMHRSLIASVLVAGLLLVGFVSPEPPETPLARAAYTVDKAHTQITFTVRHLGITNVTGHFRDFDAELEFDKNDLSTLQTSATVDVASIDTGIERRDNHLRSDDFFDAETYPSMTFESTGVEPGEGNSFTLNGNLTIKDVTMPVTLDGELIGVVEGMQGNEVAAFAATTTINRFDYGLTWNRLTEAGGIVVGEDVTITIEVQAVNEAGGTN